MMIVAVSRIPLPKTERYLYWVRVAKNNRHSDTKRNDGYFMQKSLFR